MMTPEPPLLASCAWSAAFAALCASTIFLSWSICACRSGRTLIFKLHVVSAPLHIWERGVWVSSATIRRMAKSLISFAFRRFSRQRFSRQISRRTKPKTVVWTHSVLLLSMAQTPRAVPHAGQTQFFIYIYTYIHGG